MYEITMTMTLMRLCLHYQGVCKISLLLNRGYPLISIASTTASQSSHSW